MKHYRDLVRRSLRLMGVFLFLGAVLLMKTAFDSPAFADDPEQGEPFVVEPAHFRLSNPQLVSSQPIKAVPVAQGWTEIIAEDFEDTWPAPGWTVFDADDPPSLNGEYYWDVTTCFDYNVSGDHDAVPHAAGADAAYTCWQPYPPNLNSWMVYGPFDLSDATAAELYFSFWLDSELDHDYLEWWIGTDPADLRQAGWATGDSRTQTPDGWIHFNLDLTSVPGDGELIDFTGQPQVWIAFAFTSDDHTDADHDGAWLDDIALRCKFGLPFRIYLPVVLKNHGMVSH